MVLDIASDDLANIEVQSRRKPVWWAISDLCLDTEITENMISEIAGHIKAQGFSKEEAEYIAFHEVFPVTFSNLCIPVGGEWACFDEQWLFSRIVKHSKSRWKKIPFRLLTGYSQKMYRESLQKDWDRVLALL